jgi:hypothetical protein
MVTEFAGLNGGYRELVVLLRRSINILKLHLHGVYRGEIAHDFNVLVEYPATHENCLEPIIGTRDLSPFSTVCSELSSLDSEHVVQKLSETSSEIGNTVWLT